MDLNCISATRLTFLASSPSHLYKGHKVKKAIDYLVKHLLRTADAKLEETKMEEQKKRRERKYLANNNKMGEREKDEALEKTGGEKEQEKEKGSSSPIPSTSTVSLVKNPTSKPNPLEKASIPQQPQQQTPATHIDEAVVAAKRDSVTLNGCSTSNGHDKEKEKETEVTKDTSSKQNQPILLEDKGKQKVNEGEKNENKVNELHYLIEEFYKQLKFDLGQLLRYGSFNSKRVADIRGLVKQAENEYNQLSHRLLTINWYLIFLTLHL